MPRTIIRQTSIYTDATYPNHDRKEVASFADPNHDRMGVAAAPRDKPLPDGRGSDRPPHAASRH